MSEKGAMSLSSGHFSSQGERPSMEDEILIRENLSLQNTCVLSGPLSFYGVYDGHGGRAAAIFTRDHLLDFLLAELESGKQPQDALIGAFLKTDQTFIAAARGNAGDATENGLSPASVERLDKDTSGTTAVVVLVSHALRTLWVAHVGDSRAVLLAQSTGAVRGLTNDHKADRPDEVARIRAAGGFVVHKRVMGELAISRAIGDMDFKEKGFLFVLAEPEVNEIKIQNDENYLVLACDGLYDVMTNEKVGEFICEALKEKASTQQMCEAIVDHAIRRLQTKDNVTTIIVHMTDVDQSDNQTINQTINQPIHHTIHQHHAHSSSIERPTAVHLIHPTEIGDQAM